MNNEQKLNLEKERLGKRNKRRGEAQLDRKWEKVLDELAGKWGAEVDKAAAIEKEKLLDSFVFNGKTFHFYKSSKPIEYDWKKDKSLLVNQ